MLVEHARLRPDHPFLIWEPFGSDRQRSWTYAEFLQASAAVAGGFAQRGVAPGVRVLLHAHNCPEFVLTWFACARLGAIVVTTNAHSSESELQDYVNRTTPALAVTQATLAGGLRAAGIAEQQLLLAEDFDALMSAPPAPVRPANLSSVLSCQFTSGTTSRPKGVLWTQANAVWGAKATAMHQGLAPSDVHYITNPLFHTNAQTYSLLPTLWAGGTVVLSPKFSASRFWDVSVRNGCTWHSITNFAVVALLDHEVPAQHDYRMWGGAASDPEIAESFGIPFMGWWGMTETITQGIASEPYQVRRRGAMGRPSPFYEIEIRDEAGTPIAPGGIGELFIRGKRGETLFLEYLDDPIATADGFDAEGWFITGDLVRLEDDGSITFSDRAKDMIKVGGENVAASEVETVIREVPGVSEVAVVGQPHVMLDEVPVAFVIPLAESQNWQTLRDAVIEQCRHSLASFKVPWEVHQVDSLPRSVLEKVAKVELRRGLPTLAADVRPSHSRT